MRTGEQCMTRCDAQFVESPYELSGGRGNPAGLGVMRVDGDLNANWLTIKDGLADIRLVVKTPMSAPERSNKILNKSPAFCVTKNGLKSYSLPRKWRQGENKRFLFMIAQTPRRHVLMGFFGLGTRIGRAFLGLGELLTQRFHFGCAAGFQIVSLRNSRAFGASKQFASPLAISVGQNFRNPEHQKADNANPEVETTPPLGGFSGIPTRQTHRGFLSIAVAIGAAFTPRDQNRLFRCHVGIQMSV